MLYMVLKPFSVFKLSFMAGVRAISLVINTWVELLCAFIHFNISLFWRFVVWAFSLATLPVRALAALHREKQLQGRLNELQDRVDNLEWDRKELQEHIRVAIKEHEKMEMMLGELEDEHDEAIQNIKLLEAELQDLRDENHRLNEIYGKTKWDTDTDQVVASYGYSQKHKDHYKFTDIFTHKDPFDDVRQGKLDDGDGFVKRVYWDNVFEPRREVAVSQSLFSAMLSLLVGMVIWEAEDPCMPLVTALFAVVIMSLKSVVQLFLTIKNKPGFDAVALLSLNWFILGTIAYPTLPWVAHLSAPLFNKLLGWIWFRILV